MPSYRVVMHPKAKGQLAQLWMDQPEGESRDRFREAFESIERTLGDDPDRGALFSNHRPPPLRVIDEPPVRVIYVFYLSKRAVAILGVRLITS